MKRLFTYTASEALQTLEFVAGDKTIPRALDPYLYGANPPLALQLTVVPLGLVPLTFAAAIVRYRLRDVEVIIKRGLAYTAFLAASVALYAALVKLTAFVFANDVDEHNWIIAGLATLVIVLLARPVKDSVQDALDRLFYRDRYDYRRALVASPAT